MVRFLKICIVLCTLQLQTTWGWSFPLEEVALPSCKGDHWDDLDNECKMPLKVLSAEDRQQLQDNPLGLLLYSMLRGASYNTPRDQQIGSHAGVDVATSAGTPVRAFGGGLVIAAGEIKGFGLSISIKHAHEGEFIVSNYSHLSEILVEEGDWINEGDLIGKVGNSGFTIGPFGNHLDFQITTHESPSHPYGHQDCNEGAYLDMVNEGKCREQLMAYTIDPFVFFDDQESNEELWVTITFGESSRSSERRWESVDETEENENENENDDLTVVETSRNDELVVAKEHALPVLVIDGVTFDAQPQLPTAELRGEEPGEIEVETEVEVQDPAPVILPEDTEIVENGEGDIIETEPTPAPVLVVADPQPESEPDVESPEIAEQLVGEIEETPALQELPAESVDVPTQPANILVINDVDVNVQELEQLPTLTVDESPQPWPFANTQPDLDYLIEASLNKYGSVLELNTSSKLTINVNKLDGDPVSGITKKPITIHPSSDAVTVFPSELSLIRNGKKDVLITGKRSGDVTLKVMYDDTVVEELTVTIQPKTISFAWLR